MPNLPPHIAGENKTPVSSADLREAMRVYERQHIIRMLDEADNDKKKAAEMLGIGLSSLYRKMEDLGILVDEGNSQE